MDGGIADQSDYIGFPFDFHLKANINITGEWVVEYFSFYNLELIVFMK